MADRRSRAGLPVSVITIRRSSDMLDLRISNVTEQRCLHRICGEECCFGRRRVR